MRTWQKVVGFVVALVVVLGAAIAIGRAAGPFETDDDAHDAGHDDGRMHLDPADGADGHDHAAHEGRDGGFELALERDVVDAGREQLAFRILDDAGDPVTSYDVQHEKQLHLIAVRHDLAEYRHVHPSLDPDSGRWTVPIALEAGSWRLYADFAPEGADPTVAEAELMVAGRFAPQDLGPDTETARVDGYEVHLTRDASKSTISLHVTEDGAEVTDLEPYLGAYGHLVAIRADDMAYLHVHPQDGPAGPEVTFHAELDDPGRYRLFLDFKHDGRVHTAAFTTTVGRADAEEPGDHDHGGNGDDHDQDHDHEEGGGDHDH